MKIHHFSLIAAIIFIIIISVAGFRGKVTRSLREERTFINNAVEDASWVAAEKMASTLSEEDGVNKDAAIEAYFTSLFASMNVSDMPLTQRQIRMYHPIFAITEGNGFYIHYYRTTQLVDGTYSFFGTWTEKTLFSYNYKDYVVIFNLPGCSDHEKFILCDTQNHFGVSDGNISAAAGTVTDTSSIYDSDLSKTGMFNGVYEMTLDQITEMISTGKFESSGYAGGGSSSDFAQIAAKVREEYYNGNLPPFLYKYPRSADGRINNASAPAVFSMLNRDALDFDLIQGETVASKLEEYLGYYCTESNEVAFNNGISYEFTIPAISNDDVKAMSDMAFIVLFQGYPYGSKLVNQKYNRFSFSNAQVVQKRFFYCDVANGVYHSPECPFLGNVAAMGYVKANTEEEAAHLGCRGCQKCRVNR